MSSPELSVVCKSCGSEVSPYVTECPYCGHRLRKRAPRLEREGDEIRVHESRRERRRREKRERQPLLRPLELDARPVATIGALLIAGVLVVVQRAVPLSPEEAGAIVGPVGGEIWRYVTAPFVYVDLGALIVVAAGIAIFGSAVERRLGSVATATVILATGTLGMLAADAVAAAGLDDFLVAAGGNAVALGLLGTWLMLWRAEARGGLREPLDTLGVIIAALVLLLVPLFEVTADPVANVAGGLVGLAMGWLAGRRLSTGPG
jgi:membrane associated rhomboid family serine protease